MEMLFLQIMVFYGLNLKFRLNKFVNIGPSLRNFTDKLFLSSGAFFWQKFICKKNRKKGVGIMMVSLVL